VQRHESLKCWRGLSLSLSLRKSRNLLDKGWQEIEKALAINPSDTLARHRLGVINMCRGKYEEAFRSSVALRSKRTLPSWHFILPTLYSGWGGTRKPRP